MKNGGANNLIIDGNNLLYRIFWTNNFKLDEANSPGQVFLFLRSLKSYVDKFKPDQIYAAWDKKLLYPSSNFRKITSRDMVFRTRRIKGQKGQDGNYKMDNN